jgi:hypothetical protein
VQKNNPGKRARVQGENSKGQDDFPVTGMSAVQLATQRNVLEITEQVTVWLILPVREDQQRPQVHP